MDLDKQFGTDKQKEIDGVWIDIGKGALLLIARSNKSSFTDEIRRQMKRFKGQVAAGLELPPEASTKAFIKSAAKHLLLGWKNIKVKGETVEYSQESAEKIMTDYPDFSELVAKLASEQANFRADEIAGAEKN